MHLFATSFRRCFTMTTVATVLLLIVLPSSSDMLMSVIAADVTEDYTSFTGKVPVTYYEPGNGNCSSNNDTTAEAATLGIFSGYIESLHVVKNNDSSFMCETDVLTIDGQQLPIYIRWLTTCTNPNPKVFEDGIYQQYLSCYDEDCSNCSTTPGRSSEILPWNYFYNEGEPIKKYQRCFPVKSFNATTTDLVSEFRTEDTMITTVEQSEFLGGNDSYIDYWKVYVENTCIKNGTDTNTTDDSADDDDTAGSSIASVSGGTFFALLAAATPWMMA